MKTFLVKIKFSRMQFIWIMNNVARQWDMSFEGIFISFWSDELLSSASCTWQLANRFNMLAVNWSREAREKESAGRNFVAEVVGLSIESWLLINFIVSSILSTLLSVFLKFDIACNGFYEKLQSKYITRLLSARKLKMISWENIMLLIFLVERLIKEDMKILS